MGGVTVDKIVSVLTAIVTVALVSVIVSSPETSSIIRAVGEAFSQSLQAAKH